ncbi:MAG TPA: methyltransferase domain-containing protein [Streptosporangiaceae bacterium]|nr:methyltransferase domain-containing protein [Streptosporangiaceae bacterium]
MTAPSVSPLAVLSSGSLAAYWRFHRAVASAQLAAWLPAPGGLLIDISGATAAYADQAAARGHLVLRVIPPSDETARGQQAPGTARRRQTAPDGAPRQATRERSVPGQRQPGRVVEVVAEPGSLEFLADDCADGVIAEAGALSHHLMAEDLACEIARVLRPGGRLFACVDSLVLGMAMLAEQRRWAHLVDVPRAEVFLVPWPDGTITRCFGASQLRDLLTEAGLDVRWVRPRTLLSPSMVDHVLRREPGAIARLVRAELRAGQDGQPASPDESFGISLVAAARKSPGHDPGQDAGDGRAGRAVLSALSS